MPRSPGGRFLVVLVVTSISALCHVAADLAGDRTALLAFREAVGQRLPWDTSAVSPCSWRGVTCGASGDRVVSVQLPGARLSGRIPEGTVGNLTALRVLSLRFNAIFGGIPLDIGNCVALRHLYLHRNHLTDGIPEGLFSLGQLRRLDLSGNRLTGGVSPEFSKLRRLATLYLQSNKLNGTLPADLDLPELQLFNVSNNQLTGPVPASLASLPASAFNGTRLCGKPLDPCLHLAPSPSPSPSSSLSPSSSPVAAQKSKSGRLSGGAIAGIVAGSVVAFLLVLSVLFFVCCRRGRTKAENNSGEMPADVLKDSSSISVTVARAIKDAARQPSQPAAASDGKKLVFVGSEPEARYVLEDLLRAPAEILGKGSLGTTYRASLEGGASEVTIKRLRDVRLAEREFRDKVIALGALRHENLAPLRAYFYSKEEKLLVYDFVGVGSLSSLLHGNNGAGRARLGFTARVRIALATARGIACIHGAGASSSHGNIKSSNILVTDAHDGAYVADYGIVQLASFSTPLKRAAGYRAPEVTDARRLTQKADMYSFGVLILELITGRAPPNAVPGGDAVDLPQWVRSMVQEEWTTEVFDVSIANDVHPEEMMRLLQLGMDCTEQRPDRRPTMSEVAATLERIVEDFCRSSPR